MNKNLVFSAKNPNFKNENKILLAGEWVLECEENDSELSEYEIFFSKGQLKPQRAINCVKSNEIYQNIIKDLSIQLNLLHSVNLSLRSWRIILGYWLKRFIELCYQKNYLINEIFENHEIIWNNNLFLKIINYFK